MLTITSTRNQRIQWVRALQSRPSERRKDQAFVIEGIRLVEEALAADMRPQFLLHTEDLNPRGLQVIDGFLDKGIEAVPVASHVMRAASNTKNPQGLLAVIPILPLPLPSTLNFALILDNLRIPGNLGAILRTADAAGVDAVFLPPGSTDPYSPKVVRSAMGAHFRLPIHTSDWERISAQIRDAGLRTYLAAARSDESYTQVDFHAPVALIVGGEADGAGKAAKELADSRIHIPMPREIDSLNAAAAAAILMFEVVRQRQPSNEFDAATGNMLKHVQNVS